MVAFGVGGATPKQRMTQVAAGLGLLRTTVIDQHFDQRNRYGRLLMIVSQSPAAARDRRRRGHLRHRHGRGRPRGAARQRSRGGDDPRPAAAGHELLRGEAVHSPAGQRHHPPRAARRRGVRPDDAGAPAPASPASRRRTPPSWPRPRPTCSRWRATSRPATAPRPPCGDGWPASARPARLSPPTHDPPATSPSRTEHPGDRAPHSGPHDHGDPRLPRPQHLVLRQGDPPGGRPRRPRAVPHRQAPRLHRAPARGAPGPVATTPARAAARVASSSACTRAPGSGTSPSTRRWRCSRSSATTSAAARPAGSRASPGTTTSSTATSTRTSGWRPAGSRRVWSTTWSQADPEFDWEAELESFILRAERTAFGPSTQAILDEAVSRDIPWIRLNQYSLVQLGQGVHAKRIRATMTSETSSIAVDIASDKDLTTKLLGAAGLPVPKQESVRTADQAVAAARRIGFPVVVKPLDGNHGRGVCLNLAERRRRPRGLPDRGGPVAPRRVHRRVVRHRQGLPLPDHRRPDGRHRRAGARLGHR